MIKLNYDQVNPDDYSFKGLKDGGSIVLACSLCEAPLIEIWVTRKDEKQKTTIGCIDCPHCKKDHSFQEVITGGFHIGATEYSQSIEHNEVDGILSIKVVKVKRWKNQAK